MLRLRRGAISGEPAPASSATRHSMLGGRVTWMRVAPRTSVLVADDKVVGVIDGLALAAPAAGASDHVLVRPSLGTVELVGEVPVGLTVDDVRRATGPLVELERDLLAWILSAPDERTLPHRAIVLSAPSEPALVHATAGFSHAMLPDDGGHTPPRSIEGVYAGTAVQGVHLTNLAAIATTLADHSRRYVTIDIARDGVAALAAIEGGIVEGDLLVVVMRDADGQFLVRARIDGRRAGYELGPPVTWARIWSTVSYRVVQLSMQQVPLLDELGDPLYIEAGFLDLLDRPEIEARRLLLERIDRVLDEKSAMYAARLLAPFDLACRRAGDAVHAALCHGLRGRLAELDYKYPDAVSAHRACVSAISEVCSDDDPAVTRALVDLGATLHRRELVEAIDVLSDAVARIRRRGDVTRTLGVALETLGRAQRRHGRSDDAVRTLREAFEVQRATGARWPEQCLHEIELAREADGRFTEALAVIDELRSLGVNEYQKRTLDEAEARCRIGLGELSAAAELLLAVRRETYMVVDQDRIDALLAKVPADIREAHARASASVEQATRDQVAAAEAPLRELAKARGLVVTSVTLSAGCVYLYVAPRDETDGPARASYRARCDELVALARTYVDATPVDVKVHHLEHRAGRVFEAREPIEQFVRSLLTTRLGGYAHDDPWARMQPVEVRDAWTHLDVAIGTHGPAAWTAARDLGFELIARVREAYSQYDDVPMTSSVYLVYAGTGLYPWDSCHLSPETTVLLAELRRLPRRPNVDTLLLHAASQLSHDVRAVVHTFALHAVEGEHVGEALHFDADAVESARAAYAARFVLAYDMREQGRTLVVERDRGRTFSVRWWPGIWAPDELHGDTDDDEYGMTLGSALSDLVDASAVARAHGEIVAAVAREKIRAAERARRFGERGWVGWDASDDHDMDTDIDDDIATPAGEWGVAITVGSDRDRVWRVAPDGTRTEVALPSPAPYRMLHSLTPDRTRLIVASRTRVREVALASGTTRIVMEGPWVVSVAALAEDLVAFTTVGGEHTLDRADPDVAALPSIRQLPPGPSVRLAASYGLGLCRIGDNPGLVRWIDIEDKDAVRLVPLLGGRILVLSSWSRALIVAVKEGALIPLRAMDRGWGPSVELFGLEAAWEAARPYQVAKLSLSRGQDVPAARRWLIACSDERLFLERVEVPRASRTIPARARRLLALTEADLLWDKSGTDDFVLIRDGRVRLVRVEGDHAVERAVEPPLSADFVAFADAGERLVLAAASGAWWIDRERATASSIAPLSVPTAGIAALSSERVLVLSRVEPTDVRLTLLVDGNVLSSWPVHIFDQIHALPEARLIVLSFQYMPEDLAIAVVLHVSPRGTLHLIAHARLGVRDAFERDGQVYVESSDGVFALRGLEAIGALDESAPLAGVYYSPPIIPNAPPDVRTTIR